MMIPMITIKQREIMLDLYQQREYEMLIINKKKKKLTWVHIHVTHDRQTKIIELLTIKNKIK